MSFIKRELRVSLEQAQAQVALEIKNNDLISQSHPFYLANMSRSGMFLTSGASLALEQGTTVQFSIRFMSSPKEITGTAMICWSRSSGERETHLPQGLGLRVIEFYENAEKVYLEFLETRVEEARITDFMELDPPKVSPATAIQDALHLMLTRNKNCLVIVDSQGGFLGLFASSEMARAAQVTNFLQKPVSQFMNASALALTSQSSAKDAFRMIHEQAPNYLVVTDRNKVVGYVSAAQVLPYWAEHTELRTRRMLRNYDYAVNAIAHELRTPLTLIQTSNLLVTAGEMKPEDYLQSGLPDMIQDSCNMMLRLLDDILDISKIRVGSVSLNYQQFNLSELALRAVRLFQPAASKKNITLTAELPQDLPLITADKLRLEQILNNLISNALKFSPAGEAIFLSLKQAHNEISLSVKDHGPGIPENELSQLFNEFSAISVKSTQGEASHGLGLAITRRLVEAHKGRICVDSTVGKGTNFTVFLPIAPS